MKMGAPMSSPVIPLRMRSLPPPWYPRRWSSFMMSRASTPRKRRRAAPAPAGQQGGPAQGALQQLAPLPSCGTGWRSGSRWPSGTMPVLFDRVRHVLAGQWAAPMVPFWAYRLANLSPTTGARTNRQAHLHQDAAVGLAGGDHLVHLGPRRARGPPHGLWSCSMAFRSPVLSTSLTHTVLPTMTSPCRTTSPTRTNPSASQLGVVSPFDAVHVRPGDLVLRRVVGAVRLMRSL